MPSEVAMTEAAKLLREMGWPLNKDKPETDTPGVRALAIAYLLDDFAEQRIDEQAPEWITARNEDGTEWGWTGRVNWERQPKLRSDTDGAPMIVVARYFASEQTARAIHEGLMANWRDDNAEEEGGSAHPSSDG